MTDSSQTRLSYVEETTYGETPANPAFQEARFTSESLNFGVETITSNEIRADRNVSDVIQVGANAGGGVDIEMSYGSFDDWLESLMMSTWQSNVIKNGTTAKSFSVEKMFETGATDQHHTFTGAQVDSLSLSMQSDQIMTGAFAFLAKGATATQAAIAGATYAAANTNDVIDAANSFNNIVMSGITTPALTSINLNITNNLRQQRVIGSRESRGVGAGRFEVTGDVVAYFEDGAMYQKLIDAEDTTLSFEVGGASSKKYAFTMDKVKFSEGNVLAGGNDQDVLVNMSIRAVFDGVDNTLKITRTP